MCSVSEKIVLCTCDTKNIDQLKHYWVLFRHDPEMGIILVGETMGYEFLFQEKDLHNPVILCNKLNNGGIFDQTLQFEDKDRLQISILFKKNSCNTDYGFEYRKGKWRVIEFDYFSWRAVYKELQKGKIKNALETKKEK